MLEHSHTGLLGEAERRGLVGELIFLRQHALPAYGLFPAVDGWVGPLAAEQDFRYPDWLYEVKTLQPNVRSVKISSAEQLDNAERKLQLVIVTVNNAERNNSQAFSLPDIISAIRNTLENDEKAYSLFEERLLAAGYIDQDEYMSYFYQLGGLRRFIICEGFPRITRTCLQTGIGKVTYEIDLISCIPYEIRDGESADGT